MAYEDKIIATYTLDTDEIPTIEIGVQNENSAALVRFDYSAWVKKYGEGTISLILLRRKDKDSYPVTLTSTIDESGRYLATWDVSAIDTAKYGKGKGQLSFFSGTQVKKTVIFYFMVERSIGTTNPFDYDPILILDDEFDDIEDRLELPHPEEYVSAILDSELDSIDNRLEGQS